MFYRNMDLERWIRCTQWKEKMEGRIIQGGRRGLILCCQSFLKLERP